MISRGYNGFSYKDISSELMIKNASIHYHFPQKKDLGVAVVQRARHLFNAWIEFVTAQQTPLEEVLDQFFQVYLQYMKTGNNICLGGALETDFHTLPEEMQEETKTYVSELIEWMKNLLSEGRKQGVFSFSGLPEDKAMHVLASVQGAIQMVRVKNESLFYRVLNQIKKELGL